MPDLKCGNPEFKSRFDHWSLFELFALMSSQLSIILHLQELRCTFILITTVLLLREVDIFSKNFHVMLKSRS